MFGLRREIVKTSAGSVIIEEFTIKEAVRFFSLPLSDLERVKYIFSNAYPDKKFKEDDYEKILKCVKNVNSPHVPRRKGSGGIRITLPEAMIILSERTNESLNVMMKEWSPFMVFSWLEVIEDLEEKRKGKGPAARHIDSKTIDSKTEQMRVNSDYEQLLDFFSKKWNKPKEELEKKYSFEMLKNAMRNERRKL